MYELNFAIQYQNHKHSAYVSPKEIVIVLVKLFGPFSVLVVVGRCCLCTLFISTCLAHIFPHRNVSPKPKSRKMCCDTFVYKCFTRAHGPNAVQLCTLRTGIWPLKAYTEHHIIVCQIIWRVASSAELCQHAARQQSGNSGNSSKRRMPLCQLSFFEFNYNIIISVIPWFSYQLSYVFR